MTILERIENSGLFYFDDGYLGSTNHGVSYYHGDGNLKYMNDIEQIGESKLKNIVLDRLWYDETKNHNPEINYDEFWNKWFNNTPEWEIIRDEIKKGNGYGKVIVDQNNKTITIMVVPCLYSLLRHNPIISDTKIFGFNHDTGKLEREISDMELNEILKDGNIYIG